MGWRGIVLSLCLVPQAASGDVLTFAILPSADPSKSLFCRMELAGGQITVVEVRGSGMPPRHAMRWPVRRGEAAAMGDALAALIAGDLPSVDIHSHGLPAPSVMVTWSTRVSGAPLSGQYMQSGLDLPAPLARVVDTIMPGSACQGATQ